MIVHSVSLELPQVSRPGLTAMATCRTDRGVYVFAVRTNGRVFPCNYKFNELWRNAFQLPPDDERVIAAAIRAELDNASESQ